MIATGVLMTEFLPCKRRRQQQTIASAVVKMFNSQLKVGRLAQGARTSRMSDVLPLIAIPAF